MMRVQFAMSILCVATISVYANAGAAKLVGSNTIGTEGQPITWNATAMPIGYVLDSGPLGSLTNDQANQILQQAMDVWQEVSSASVSFAGRGPIATIPSGDVKTITDYDQVMSDCQNTLTTAIVFDEDGSLFTALFSDSSIIGFSSICSISAEGHISSGVVAFNGMYASNGDAFKAAVIHELGHLLGLDHSQIECFDTCTVDDYQATPIMYPVSVNPGRATLAPDDIATLSALYPSTTFTATYGLVSGVVLFSDNTSPIQGVNVVFRQVDDPSTPTDESRARAFSIVSGYRFTGNFGQSYTATYLPCARGSACEGGYLDDNSKGDQFGSRNIVFLGTFDVALPAGTYTLQLQSVEPGSSGSSSVGPLNPPIPIPGQLAFWSVGGPSQAVENTPIRVVSGATLSNVVVILNDTEPTCDLFDFCMPSESQTASAASMLRIAGIPQ